MSRLFSFLYVSDWQTGRRKLSHLRIVLLCAGLLLLLIAIMIVVFLHTPVVYML